MSKALNNFDFSGRIVSFGFVKTQNGYQKASNGQQGLRQTRNGKHYIKFTIAMDRNQKNQQGHQISDFAPMFAWNKTADYVSKMNQGDTVLGTARFASNSFTGRDGKRHFTWGFGIKGNSISRIRMSKASRQQYQQFKQSQGQQQPQGNMNQSQPMNNGNMNQNNNMDNQNNQSTMNMNQNNGQQPMNNDNNMNNNQPQNNGNKLMNGSKKVNVSDNDLPF